MYGHSSFRWFQLTPDDPTASGPSGSPQSHSLMRRARRSGAAKRHAPKFSDSDISEPEEGGEMENEEPSASSGAEEESYIPVPPTVACLRSSRRQGEPSNPGSSV